MKNIHLIATEKPSILYFWGDELRVGDLIQAPENLGIYNQHIYITSDEEIKKRDWCIDKHNIVFKQETDKIFPEFTGSKKIILTTDQDLIKDGVQPIDDEFLEWFIKNPNCESVEIREIEVEDYVGFAGHTSYPTFHNKYKITIPKEEPLTILQIAKNIAAIGIGEPKQENCCTPVGHIRRYKDCIGCDRKPKQETLEEAAKNTTIKYINEREKQTAYLEFIAGAKWHEKRSYSEEDMINFTEWVIINYQNQYKLLTTSDKKGFYTVKELLIKWFNQFKKK